MSMDLLRWWDGELYSDYEHPPQKTFIDDDGNWVALWWWSAMNDDEVSGRKADEIVAGVERVIFTPDSFIVSLYTDLMEWGDEPYVNDEGEPLFDGYGEMYEAEHVEFDREPFLKFLKDVIEGRVKRGKLGPGPYNVGWKRVESFKLGKRKRLPRTKEELAQWVLSAGVGAIRSGPGGDWEDELPEGVPETP